MYISGSTASNREFLDSMSSPANAARPDLAALRIDKDKRKERKTGKVLGIILAAILLIAVVAGAAYYSRNTAPIVEVSTAQKAGTGPTALLNASGYVTPRRRATIAAKITGRVVGVYFDEGVHVKEGQILAKLDDADVKRALDSAIADRNSTQAQTADYQVQLKNAELLVHRAKELQAAGVQSQEVLDNALTSADSLRAKMALTKEQVAASEARINEAQQTVDNTVIRAPFEGIVVSKDAQVGEMVSPVSAGGGFTRTGIATIVDMNSNEIEVDVNEAYIARVVAGMPVTAVLDAYPDWQIPSKVRTVIPTADRQKATVKVRISFIKLDPRILPDMGVKVTFLGDEPKKQAGAIEAVAAIPSSALRDENGSKIVFLLKDNKLERRAVKPGNARGSDVEIFAGLVPGDIVVTKGPPDLHDGETVQLKK
jgi:RND family efflux transporter MFP subunit